MYISIPRVRSSSIIQHQQTSLIRNLFACPLVWSRHQSTDQSLIKTAVFEQDPQNKTMIHDKVNEIINKHTKTKDDLQELIDIMLKASEENKPYFNKHRHTVLQILLQYKKYNAFYEIYHKIEEGHEELDSFLLVQYYLMKEEIVSIQELIRNCDPLKNERLLSYTTSFMNDVLKRPLKAYKLWLILSLNHSSNFSEAFEQNASGLSSVLPSILSKFTVYEAIYDSIRSLIPEETVRAQIYTKTGETFASMNNPEFLKSVWYHTHRTEKSPEFLNQLMKGLAKYQFYREAVPLYRKNKRFWNDEVQTTFNSIISVIGANASGENTSSLILKGEISIDDVHYTLKSLLLNGKLEDFDLIIKNLEKSPMKKTVGIINLEMERASRDVTNDGVLQYLQSIYEIKEAPNSETFEIIYKQFAKHGDVNASIQLLDLLVQRKNILNIKHFTSMILACIKAQDPKPVSHILTMMEQTKVKPSPLFITVLMKLYYSSGQFKSVEEIFHEYAKIVKPEVGMYHVLIKSLFARKQDAAAHTAFSAMRSTFFKKGKYFHLVEIDYYSHLGLFVNALNVLSQMKENGIKTTYEHYNVLMKNYNKWGRYEDSVVVFNAALNDGHESEPAIYKSLIIALVKLNVINKGNYEKPIELVDGLIKASNENKSPLKGILPFSVVKPLIRALIRFYKPDDAHRIMANYLTVNTQLDTDYRLNYMKEELKLAAAKKKWETYGLIYEKFQHRIKALLDLDGLAPHKLKKIYNGLLKSLYLYHHNTQRNLEFARLFHDLLFLHGFTFTSHHMNWVARRLIRRAETFEYGMKIIEKKLIGGFIGHKLTRISRANARRNKLRVSPFNYNGSYIKPTLAMGVLTHEMLLKKVYDRISTRRDIDSTRYEDMKRKYPVTMRSLKEVHARFQRRKRYFERIGVVSATRYT